MTDVVMTVFLELSNAASEIYANRLLARCRVLP